MTATPATQADERHCACDNCAKRIDREDPSTLCFHCRMDRDEREASASAATVPWDVLNAIASLDGNDCCDKRTLDHVQQVVDAALATPLPATVDDQLAAQPADPLREALAYAVREAEAIAYLLGPESESAKHLPALRAALGDRATLGLPTVEQLADALETVLRTTVVVVPDTATSAEVTRLTAEGLSVPLHAALTEKKP
jgi:hypothetical protein